MGTGPMKTKARLSLILQGPLRIRERRLNEGCTKHTSHIPVNDNVLTRHLSDTCEASKESSKKVKKVLDFGFRLWDNK